jgi:hypothetical protein
MCIKEKLRVYRPDFSSRIEDMDPEEILKQYLYLESGAADEKDERKSVSLGLPVHLRNRRDDLHKHIVSSLTLSVAEFV